MREIIVLDGVKIDIKNPDLNKDGKAGGIEDLPNPSFSGETEIITPNNDSELIRELNKDELEKEIGMSSIDMKANLYPVENTAIMAFNSLVSFRFLPRNCLPLTRVKLRLSRSLILPKNTEGVGGRQTVEMITGKRELDSKAGFNLFGNRKESQVTQK